MCPAPYRVTYFVLCPAPYLAPCPTLSGTTSSTRSMSSILTLLITHFFAPLCPCTLASMAPGTLMLLWPCPSHPCALAPSPSCILMPLHPCASELLHSFTLALFPLHFVPLQSHTLVPLCSCTVMPSMLSHPHVLATLHSHTLVLSCFCALPLMALCPYSPMHSFALMPLHCI